MVWEESQEAGSERAKPERAQPEWAGLEKDLLCPFFPRLVADEFLCGLVRASTADYFD